MDKYFAFRKMMDFVSDYAEITDADMNYCGNTVMIEAENDDEIIVIEVTIKKKEVRENA